MGLGLSAGATLSSVSGRLSFLHRLTADANALDAVELQSYDSAGRLRAVVYNPRVNVPTLEAELFDGSAAIDLVWLGRRRINGIEPGRWVMVKGRVGVHEGRHAIYNPWYELRAPV